MAFLGAGRSGRIPPVDGPFHDLLCAVTAVEATLTQDPSALDCKSGLSVVGVSVDEDGWKSVKPFLAEKRVNYPVVIGNWELAKLFGAENGLPVTLLTDREGKIADLHGMVEKSAFESEILLLLKENAPKRSSK